VSEVVAVPTFGLTTEERQLLEQVGADGCLVNVLMEDGERREEGFVRERTCQHWAERGLLKFLGWAGAPRPGADWTSRWTLTEVARRSLANDVARPDEPAWLRSLRGASRPG
jgi:hypothetical protein